MARMRRQIYLTAIQSNTQISFDNRGINEECILEIFSRISILDAFNIRGVFGKKIDSLLNRRIKNCKRLKTKLRNFPDYKTEHLLELGYNLQKIIIEPQTWMCGNEVLNLLVPLLKGATASCNLRALTLNNVACCRVTLQYLYNVMFQLKYLDLSFCDLGDSCLDYLLPNALNVRTLKLIGNPYLMGYGLKNLPKRKSGKCVLKLLEIQSSLVWQFDHKRLAAEQPRLQIIFWDPWKLGYVSYNQKV